MRSRTARSAEAAGWVSSAALMTFGVLAIFSIGLLLLIAAAMLITWLGLRDERDELPRTALQLVTLLAIGSACAFAILGIINLPSAPPCTGEPLIASPEKRVAECSSGNDAIHWFVASGILLIIATAATVGQRIARSKGKSPTPGPASN